MNSAMAAYMLPAAAAAFRLAVEATASTTCDADPSLSLCIRAAAMDRLASELVTSLNRVAVNHAVDGTPLYYRRAWISPGSGWVGCSAGSCPPGVRSNDSAVWLEPNAWALLAGVP